MKTLNLAHSIVCSVFLCSTAPLFAVSIPVSISFSSINSNAYPSTFTDGWVSDNGFRYTTTGLELSWITRQAGTGPTAPEAKYWEIVNKTDVTGTGPFLDRYISVTVDPAALYNLSEWTIYAWYTQSQYRLDNGEGFEIRSSIDDFNAPIMRMVGDGQLTNQGIFPDGTEFLGPFALFFDLDGYPNVSDPSLIQTHHQPVEFRYYYWGTNPDGSSAWNKVQGEGGAGFTFTLNIVPEPSKFIFLSMAGLSLGLWRRKSTV